MRFRGIVSSYCLGKPTQPHTRNHHWLLLLLLPRTVASFSSSPSSQRSVRWNSKTSVVITNPVLLLLESCDSMSQLKQIQSHMITYGLISHTFPVSRVLAFCALSYAGDLGHARVLFDRIDSPNTYMWNTMIRGYARAGMGAAGLGLFLEMIRLRVELDRRSFIFALKACESFDGSIEAGDFIHCMVRKMGFDGDLLVLNGLLHFYAEFGVLSLARKVFDEIPHRDVYSWTSMIDGYVGCDYAEEALRLFESMLQSNVRPNEVTVIPVLSACSKRGDLNFGKIVHEVVRKENVGSSLNVNNALIDMYVKCGCLTRAREIFDGMQSRDVFSWTSMVNGYAKSGDPELARMLFNAMPEKNVVSWTTMVAGYSQNNRPGEALSLFEEMIGTGVVPVENTLVCALSACGQLGLLDTGRGLYDSYIASKIVPFSVILGNAFIDMYAKCGCIEEAAQIFEEMPGKDLVSWNSMIKAYAVHGHPREALALFNQLCNSGPNPDDITFLSVLSACSHAGLVPEGREHFESMIRYGIHPKVEHYACLIDLCGRRGLIQEAYELATSLPFKPSEAIWGAILSACRMHGDTNMAKVAGDKVLELDPEDSGVYSLLAEVYAKGKEWGEVSRVRRMMRERKAMKKAPGHSSIKLDGKFHEFLAADESHPRKEAIYWVINQLRHATHQYHLSTQSDIYAFE
ncbi:hypothetical protein MLD38_033037 [Melastoma candidum]|uniref:Uncharacterized protein n=1 Tax=Melastoma candidum TaxID=119954 RepID=A0ACB9M6R8_9MYRT|nr:hypothetical protein MLD38_033037 [Melastoma candidum]